MTVRGVTGMQRVKWYTSPTRCHMMAQLESSLGRLSHWRTGFWGFVQRGTTASRPARLVELLSDGRKQDCAVTRFHLCQLWHARVCGERLPANLLQGLGIGFGSGFGFDLRSWTRRLVDVVRWN